jgi:serine phosphatase RsbU (regulator of sigma subunit)/pSer/pThr/pTyr-binding forkhead associated (FHA) protein
MNEELNILSPDGAARTIPLKDEAVLLGRSIAAGISFPDDTGLSRQHLVFEKDGAAWAVRDLDSKNGTTLNGSRIVGRALLEPGDRIGAGHLVITFDRADARKPVVVFDTEDETSGSSSSATVVTDLGDLIEAEKPAKAHIAASHISALVRAGNELAGHRPLPELFPFILDLSIQAVNADRGLLLVLEEGELVVKAHRGQDFRISTAVRDRVLNTGISLMVRDTASDDALRERRSIVDQNVQTLMAVPLQTNDRVIGIIYVDSPPLKREFTIDDLNLLTVMANVAAIRIEHTRFAEIEQARQIMARELEQAADIQRQFLPAAAPAVEGLDLAGHNAACHTVGGDYYDFFPYGNRRVAMVLGDVSGKGMPASLLMMGLQARVQVLIEEPDDLAGVMTKLNRITCANCPDDRFITLFFCILDSDDGRLLYCNAGHNPPLIVRENGAVEELPGANPVIGMVSILEYQQFYATLNSGDTLVIYSDGVTEAINPDGVEFGTARLGKTVADCRSEPASQMIEKVRQALTVYTGGAPQSDDITLVIARKL